MLPEAKTTVSNTMRSAPRESLETAYPKYPHYACDAEGRNAMGYTLLEPAPQAAHGEVILERRVLLNETSSDPVLPSAQLDPHSHSADSEHNLVLQTWYTHTSLSLFDRPAYIESTALVASVD